MKKLTLLAVAAVVAPLANEAIIYDTLTQAYDSGNGNCLGGDALFGAKYDLQAADDFTIGSATTITAVTVRNLTFTGANPGSAVLRIMNDSGGMPGSTVFEGTVGTTGSSFSDTVFGLLGVDVRAGGLSIGLAAGTYWVGLQAATSSDWHYTARSTANGGNSVGRDGTNGNGGYGTTNWTEFGALGYGSGEVNMRIEGDVVPEPMTMIALGAGLAALAARRRK